MSHTDLNKLMENLARTAGVEINLNHNISALRGEENFPLSINGKKFDKVIGCGGAHSFIRKEFNLSEPRYRLGILGFLEEKSNLSYVETWPCRNGFLWKIPRGTKIEYGIIADPLKAKIIFDKFLKKNNIQFTGMQSRIIPQGFSVPFSSSVTLCGDAAGLTKPWSGGGVVWGLTAAEILLKTFPDFLNYHRQMKFFFIPRIVLSKIAVKIIYYIGFKIPFLLPKKVRIESDFLL
jgi:flavin-dependent dehydrogenase